MLLLKKTLDQITFYDQDGRRETLIIGDILPPEHCPNYFSPDEYSEFFNRYSALSKKAKALGKKVLKLDLEKLEEGMPGQKNQPILRAHFHYRDSTTKDFPVYGSNFISTNLSGENLEYKRLSEKIVALGKEIPKLKYPKKIEQQYTEEELKIFQKKILADMKNTFAEYLNGKRVLEEALGEELTEGPDSGPPTVFDKNEMYIELFGGPIRATEKQANKNIRQFIKDIGLQGISSRRIQTSADDEGYFVYKLTYNGIDAEVEMSGIPLKYVRYTERKGQVATDFPELLVDGSSWWWISAMDILRHQFLNDEE